MLTVESTELEPFLEQLVQEIGSPPDIAARVAESLVIASLRGHNSHGVRRVKIYYDWIQDDSHGTFPLDPGASPLIESEGPTTAKVNGNNAFGQVVGKMATDAVVKRATQSGIGAVGIRDAAHLGRIGEWAERATDENLLFGAFVNTQGGMWIAPPGSAQRRYSTNPVAFGVPTFDALPFPIILDIATSQVANGKIKEYSTKDGTPHKEWTIRPGGNSITDPDAFLEGVGSGLPLGGRSAGYKGFGLAMISELFAAITGDGLTVGETQNEKYGNAALFFAIDPLLFSTRERIEERIKDLHEHIRSTEFDPDISAGAGAYGDQAYFPGEPEYLTTQTRKKEGIPLPAGDVADLIDLAAQFDFRDKAPQEFDPLLDS